jgi:hypothetical protein
MNGREMDILFRSCDDNGRKRRTDVSKGNRMAEGKLQIDQRVDRIEEAIMILAEEWYKRFPEFGPDMVDKIEQTLKGKTPVPWPTQEVVGASEEN